jgi:hypothetical protein
VYRTDSPAITAQPRPNANRIEPVVTLSAAPGKTTRMSRRAVAIPAPSEPAMTRATGTRRRTVVGSWVSLLWVGWVWTLMAASLSQ